MSAAIEPFQAIYDRAAARKGGADTLEERLKLHGVGEKTPEELARIPSDRLLAEMTRRVFQAGFNWSVVDAKWPAFERAFDGFDVARWRMMSDADLDRLLADDSIVRHAKKIESVRDNAIFLHDLAARDGSAAQAIAHWPDADYVGLLDLLKRSAARLGGASGQYFLRSIGKPSFVLSTDVVAALVAAGVIEKAPTSKKALAATQTAFNAWSAESGRSLTSISRVLAMSTGV